MLTTGGRPVVSVLGASGFLGGAIVRALAFQPVRLRAVSRRPTTWYLPSECSAPTMVTADLTDADAVAEAVGDADAVIVAVAHVTGDRGWRVADDDTHAATVNTGVARAVARACAARGGGGPAPVVVFAGSTTQAGHHPHPLTGSEPDRPVTAYDRQKLAAERALLTADRAGACRAVSLRLPTVFGPPASTTAVDKGVVSLLVRRALAGEPLTLWHDGEVERDLLFVDDAAAAFVAALRAPDQLAGRAWIVGSGRGVTLRRLAEAVAEEAARLTGGPRARVRRVPPPSYASPLDLRSVRLDPTAYRRATGWSAATGWREAVRRTAAFLHAAPHHCHSHEGAR